GSRPEPVYLESNTVRLEVLEPSGADAKAITFFHATEEFERLLSGGPTSYCETRNGPACFEEVRRFTREHRDSVYVPDVVWNLASTVGKGRLGVEPKYDVAAELYRQFLQE